jgi:hypothetical protein
VEATLEDVLTLGVSSTIQRVEGYIISANAKPNDRYYEDPGEGLGFPLSPRDGLYNEAPEEAYAYIPMPTVNALGVGTHQMWIRAQDASGNWGTAVAGVLEITAP